MKNEIWLSLFWFFHYIFFSICSWNFFRIFKNIYFRTHDCGAGLAALRDEHILILENIRNTEDTGGGGTGNNVSPVLEERIAAVTDSLEKLEVGVAESGVLIALSGHFERLEADRTLARLEMRRMQVSQQWMIDSLLI